MTNNQLINKREKLKLRVICSIYFLFGKTESIELKSEMLKKR